MNMLPPVNTPSPSDAHYPCQARGLFADVRVCVSVRLLVQFCFFFCTATTNTLGVVSALHTPPIRCPTPALARDWVGFLACVRACA